MFQGSAERRKTLRVFGEVYGLMPGATSIRYRADYSLARTDNPSSAALEFSFEREAPASEVAREMLDITPERLLITDVRS